jgi:ABC-type Fe3+-hydroxamate transport system substrate-binding protein
MIPAKSVLPFVLPALAAMTVPAASGQARSPVTIVDSLRREIVVPGRVERIISVEP